MRIIFDRLDINKDNSISPEEFEKMLLSWGKSFNPKYYPIRYLIHLLFTGLEFSKANIEHIIKSFSTSSTTSLNFSDFKTITEFLIKVKSTFLKYDANNDGNIDKDKLTKALEDFAFKLPMDALKKLTSLFDTDKRQVKRQIFTNFPPFLIINVAARRSFKSSSRWCCTSTIFKIYFWAQTRTARTSLVNI